ncbi:MAG: hypothetical protein U9Q29_02780 [Campylobacterota bacterium]|nr:hypothetical protein [Campylobacterota bacterium]
MKFSNSPSQKFSSIINEVLHKFEVNYNNNGFWVMDIKNEDVEILGIKLVCGIDILAPFPSLDFTMKCDSNKDPQRFTLDTFEFEING